MLENAGIPYAVVGRNAVAAWVSRVDEAAVRNTQDVDVFIRRDDLPRVNAAFEAAGFIFGSNMDVQFLLDGPEASVGDAVYLLMAGEEVKPHYLSPTPDVSQSHRGLQFQVIDLQPLVEMKLNSWRRKDQVHLLDLIGIRLVDQTWTTRFSPVLGQHLQELLDNPEG